MTIECSDRIPIDKFNLWHEILCSTGGRYIRNPIFLDKCVYVEYKAGDYKQQCDMYHRLTMSIIEKRKDHKWRVILRRLLIKLF